MNDSQVISLRPYLDIIYRHRLSAICVLVVGLGITFCLYWMLPNIYQSTTVVLVLPQEVSRSYVSAPSAEDTANRVRILNDEALSRTRLEAVIRDLDLYPGMRARHAPMDEIVDYMRRHISVELGNQEQPDKPLNSFRLTFEYTVPALAQKVAARLADTYINEDLNQRATQAEAASSFLKDQVANARSSLDAKANEIRVYKLKYAGSLPEQLEANLQELERLQDRLASLNAAFSKVQEVSPETKLTQLETKLTTLRAQYSDSHPDVIALRAQIEALRKKQRQVDSQASTRNANDQSAAEERLEAERKNVRKAITDIREQIAQTPSREQELAALNHDYDVLLKNYEQLLHKQLEAQVSARLEQRQEGGRLRVLDPANLPLQPIRPNRPAVIVMGVLFSVFAALGLPFALFFTDTSFKDPDELSRECGVKVLATIPQVDEVAGRWQRHWTMIRAGLASGLALSAAWAAVWIYATRFF